jgi:hypothetical protein
MSTHSVLLPWLMAAVLSAGVSSRCPPRNVPMAVAPFHETFEGGVRTGGSLLTGCVRRDEPRYSDHLVRSVLGHM